MKRLLTLALAGLMFFCLGAVNVRGGGVGGGGRTPVSQFTAFVATATGVSSGGAVSELTFDADAAVQTNSLTWLAADGTDIIVPAGITIIEFEFYTATDNPVGEGRVINLARIAGSNSWTDEAGQTGITMTTGSFKDASQTSQLLLTTDRLAVSPGDDLTFGVAHDTGGTLNFQTTSYVRISGYAN